MLMAKENWTRAGPKNILFGSSFIHTTDDGDRNYLKVVTGS